MSNLKILASFKRVLGIVIFSLIVIFLFGLVNVEHASLGIPEPMFIITEQIEIIFDTIFWIIIGLFILELFLIYLGVRNLRLFARIYWLEIVLLGGMLVFGGFEILNLSLPILDKIKISKTAFKILKISLALLDQIKLSRTSFEKFQRAKKSE